MMMSEQILSKPFLRWAGSKKKLLPQLVKYWHKGAYERYIEPFAGSAQLYFAISPKRAILNDINQELVNTYLVLKSDPKALYLALSAFPRTKEFYYELRGRNLLEMNSIEKAARFIFLNKLCFNGLYRTNTNGDFNVPYSASSDAKFPTLEELMNISESLRNMKFLCADFEFVVRSNAQAGDFVYLDPPYALANSKIFYQYDAKTFGLNDIERLKILLNEMDQKGVHFLLSYADTDEIAKAFQDWHVERVITQRNIAGFSKNRRIASELLISNCYGKN